MVGIYTSVCMHILTFMSVSPDSIKYKCITYILYRIFNVNIYECECL